MTEKGFTNLLVTLGLAILILAIPLTVKLTQIRQDTRNLAVYPTEPTTEPTVEPTIEAAVQPTNEPTPEPTLTTETQPSTTTTVSGPPPLIVYIPALSKFVQIKDNSIYDNASGNLLGSIDDYADYEYLQKYSVYSTTITPLTFETEAWKKLRDAADNALLDASPDYKIQAINTAFHDNITYDPKIRELIYSVNGDLVKLSGNKDWEEALSVYNKDLPLEYRIENEKTICYDFAAAEHAYLTSRNIDSKIIINPALSHAYLLVDIQGEKYVVDPNPSKGYVVPLDIHSEKYQYDINNTYSFNPDYFAPLGNFKSN